MAVDFDLLVQLRQAGVKQIEFSVNNEVRLVEFFDPRLDAEAKAAEVVAKHLDGGAMSEIERIRRTAKDETISAEERRIAEQMLNDLYYGSSR